MKSSRYILILLILLGPIRMLPQNLVPNPGFEQNNGLPLGLSQWFFLQQWTSPNTSTPDYYHLSGQGDAALPGSGQGTILPFAGEAITGLITFSENQPEYREYLSVALNRQMTGGKPYLVSLAVSNGLSSGLRHANNGLGIFFSVDSIAQQDDNRIDASPQVSLDTVFFSEDWQVLSFRFTPVDNFRFLTIGSFRSDAQTQRQAVNSGTALFPFDYLFLDEVSVERDFAFVEIAQSDTAFCGSGSLQLSASGDPPYQWFDSQQPNQILGTDSILNIGIDQTRTILVKGSCSLDSITIRIDEPAFVDLGNDTLLCPGESLVLNVAQPGAIYLWEDGTTDPNRVLSSSGTYSINLKNGCGTAVDEIDLVVAADLPNLELGSDTAICEESSFLIQANPDLNAYRWQNGSTGPEFIAREAGMYALRASDPETGCPLADSIQVSTIVCAPEVFFANAFSPNGDGHNETFSVFAEGLDTFQLRIFNQWGEVIFESSDISTGWDGTHRGKSCQEGVYSFVVQYKSAGSPEFLRAGTVILIR